jgi:hypothetical protein
LKASLYIIFLFGSQGLFSLILGDSSINEAKLMQQQLSGGADSGFK